MAVITETRVVDVRRMQLDEILRQPQADAGELMTEWMDDIWQDGPVLIKSNDGKPMKVPFGNRWLTFPPKGRRVNRAAAVTLLQDNGKYGKYYQMDTATGLRFNEWNGMAEKQRAAYNESQLNFQMQYLTHVPGPFDDDEFDALYAETPTPSPFVEEEEDDATEDAE